MEKRVFDPPIPYIGSIDKGAFVPQKLIRILGTVPSVAHRFNVNLQCGAEINSQNDIAAQVSVRLLDGYISLNSQENGAWNEELHGPTLPIKCARNFEITLQCDFTHYKIAINGEHYFDFPQRIDHSRITHLAVDGDVSIIQISHESIGSTMNTVKAAPTLTLHIPKKSENYDPEISSSSPSPFSGCGQPLPYSNAMFYNNGVHALPRLSVSSDHSPSLRTPSPGVSPYPICKLSAAQGMPYPLPSTPGISSPSRSCSVALEAPPANIHSIRRSRRNQICYYSCSIFFGILFIITMVFIRIRL